MSVELRDFRLWDEGEEMVEFRGCDLTTFGDRESVRITRQRWEALGKPTYIVGSLRTETFAESTQ